MGEFTKRRGDDWIFDLPFTKSNAQNIIIEGGPTGGTFVTTYQSQDGQITTTTPIAYNATAANVQTALETLPNVTAGDVTVTGGPGPGTAWLVTINTVGAYLMTVAGTFTGGVGVSIRVERAVFDLTGATVRATFKNNTALADDAGVPGVFKYAWVAGVATGITVATPANGKAVLKVPKADTAQFQVAKYSYDVQLSDSTGQTETPDEGSVTVKIDVTVTAP